MSEETLGAWEENITSRLTALEERVAHLDEKIDVDLDSLYDLVKRYNKDSEKRIEALESDNKLLKQITKEKIEYALVINEELEKSEGSNEFSSKYREKQEAWLKQLEGKQ